MVTITRKQGRGAPARWRRHLGHRIAALLGRGGPEPRADVARASESRRVQVVAFFASPDDMRHIAPQSRALARANGTVHVGASLIARGALVGSVVLVLLLVAAASIANATDLFRVPASALALLGVWGALAGATLGVVRTLVAPRAIERELERQRARGLVESVLDTDELAAPRVAHELEARGALEATVLPRGVCLVPSDDGSAPPPVAPPVDTFGGTLVAGDALLATAVRHLEGEAVKVALFARASDGEPVHSSTGGPSRVHAAASPGDVWWRAQNGGSPRRLAFVDGDLLVVEAAAPFIVETVAAHTNDTVESALARVAERCACPDESARIVVDAVDSGGIGLVLLGTLGARRRAVEFLSFAASVASEGESSLAPQEQLARAA